MVLHSPSHPFDPIFAQHESLMGGVDQIGATTRTAHDFSEHDINTKKTKKHLQTHCKM